MGTVSPSINTAVTADATSVADDLAMHRWYGGSSQPEDAAASKYSKHGVVATEFEEFEKAPEHIAFAQTLHSGTAIERGFSAPSDDDD